MKVGDRMVDNVVIAEQLLIKKRDGRTQTYNPSKIRNALLQASKNAEQTYLNTELEMLTEEVTIRVEESNLTNLTTSIIDKLVLDCLYDYKMIDLIECYIRRHQEKTKNREISRDINKKIEQLISKDPTVVNENANKASNVFNTQRDLTAGSVAKTIGLKMLPPHVANAHEKGDIHYHDLDYTPYAPMTNCCLIDFKTMFEEGFEIGNAQVQSPKSIQTAAAQTAQIIANVASSQYGGCSFDRVDEVLAPYAKLNYDKNLDMVKEWITDPEKQEAFAIKKTKKDIYDAMQSLEYEINTLYTSQGQTPFTTLGF